jgi:hypothetical protein
MMKKVLAFLMLTGMVLGLAGAASAAPPEDAGPGPNGHNDHGLCTAYFNGQKKGHDEGNSPGPFGVLEDEAGEYDADNNEDGSEETAGLSETDPSDDVLEYCNSLGVIIGGNPEHNGRWDCSDAEGDKKAGPSRDSDSDGELECYPQGTEPPVAA